jgi:hypothetical protein
MLLIINTLSAQGLTLKNIEKPTKKNEIGLSIEQFTGLNFTYRREIKANKYWRFDASMKKREFIHRIGLSFGIEHRVPIGRNFSLYHGWNLNLKRGSLVALPLEFPGNTTTISLGYRLGMRYDINKRLFIGAEVNPQVGVSFLKNGVSGIISSRVSVEQQKIMPFNGLGGTTFSIGMKF